MKLTQVASPKSLSRVREPERSIIKVAAVQINHNVDPAAHTAKLLEAIEIAVDAGAQIIFLPELTLSRYPRGRLTEMLSNWNQGQRSAWFHSRPKNTASLFTRRFIKRRV